MTVKATANCMSKSLAKTVDVGKSAWNIVKSVGPFIVAQSDKASEAFARHKARVASVEIAKELIIDEAKKLNDVKKQLLGKYAESDFSERLRIKQNLEFLDASMNQLNIAEKALLYLPKPQKEQETTVPTKEISPHWMDKFNELARARNEQWRQEILARALAREASTPGGVIPRALWLIGTLEENLFHAFACVLDLCCSIGRDLMIPSVGSKISDRKIPNCVFGDKIEIGNLVFMLQDIGVLANPSKTEVSFHKDAKILACYFGKRYIIKCRHDALKIRGITTSTIGQSIACFYQRKYNKLGEEIFQSWIGSLNKDMFEVKEASK